MKTRTLAAFVAAAVLAACTVGPDYVRPAVDTPNAWRIDYPKAADVANTKWWEQFGDPVLNELIETALRDNRDVRIAAARVDQFIGALDGNALAVVPADRLQRRRESLPLQPPRRPGHSLARRPVLHVVPGIVGRLVANRSVRACAPLDRSGTGAGVCERAGPARRRAVVGGGRGVELHRNACARPPARDRASDGAQFRCDGEAVRLAFPRGHRVADGSDADPVAIPAGVGRDSRHRTSDRRAGELHLHPARTQPGADPEREDDRPARCAAHSRGSAFRAAGAPAGYSASGAEPRRRQRQHRRDASALLSDHFPHGCTRQREPGVQQFPQRSGERVVDRRRVWRGRSSPSAASKARCRRPRRRIDRRCTSINRRSSTRFAKPTMR